MVTEEIIELSKFAHREGADACIILPPYYFPLSAASIENYYDHIASQLADQELYLYNFPDRTGYTIPVPTTLNLLRKHKNIKGYKDTQAGVSHTLELVKTVKKEFPYLRYMLDLMIILPITCFLVVMAVLEDFPTWFRKSAMPG